jgi:hypothetical protein
MDDAIITGIFTLLGTILGFGLLKISDIIKEKNEREKNQTLLIFKLVEMRTTMNTMKEESEKLIEITNLEDLDKIRDILTKHDIRDAISKIEMLFEKTITPDIKNPNLFTLLAKLRIILNDFLTIQLVDEKQLNGNQLAMNSKSIIINKLSEIISTIDEICLEIYDIRYPNKSK